ncbi:meiosis 1 arrest protein isoform X2 [Pelobates fuscus]|uniref:meiosis 1 arrest protein isoform X2 n=1 Tax=Pelobates fuscus TaxID=191477 RepID=UPI002FE4E24D
MSSSRGRLGPLRTLPRALLLDVAPPGWALIAKELSEALSNTFSVSAAFTQPQRLLSIYTVRERHQCLLPLLKIRGNLPRLLSCLSELRSLPRDGSCGPWSGAMALAVLDSLQQNKQWMQHNVPGATGHNCFMEVTVVSTRLGGEVVAELDLGLKDADLGLLQRLLVVQICNTTGDTVSDSCPESRTGLSVCDTEVRLISGDTLSIESFFKSWLFESCPEKEQLRVIVPSGDTPLCLICDVQQRIINTEILHQAQGQDCALRANQRDSPQEKVTQVMRVLRAVSNQGVCGSLLYGLPTILLPTTCWELDWDQLESNQEEFYALCHCLLSQELSLLACSTQRSLTPLPPVMPHFIISASDSPALLLRSVATRELVLPLETARISCPLPDNTLHTVQVAVRQSKARATVAPLSLVSPTSYTSITYCEDKPKHGNTVHQDKKDFLSDV